MMILGLDPGPLETAYCMIDDRYWIQSAGKAELKAVLRVLESEPPGAVAIESIQSYGMAVGRSVFDTCYSIGRILQRCDDLYIPWYLYPRPEYTRRICGVGKINDAVLRQALLLRFGGDRKGEALYQLKGNTDKRSAFAVAVYHVDILRQGKAPGV
jgi:hypothetical protein